MQGLLCKGLINIPYSNQECTCKVASAALAWCCDQHMTLRLLSMICVCLFIVRT